MAEKFKITYNLRMEDKNSPLFGVLIEKTKTFSTLRDAMNFVRTSGEIVGKPLLTEKRGLNEN